MSLTLKRFTNKDDDAWAHWPALRRAIEEAGMQFGQKSLGALLDRVLGTFVIFGRSDVPVDQQETTAVWYAVNDAGDILGHLVALEDSWDGGKCVYVNQLWARNIPRELQQLAAEELDHYARSRGASAIYMYTRRDCPRYWKRAFGYERFRVLYRRQIAP